MHSFEELYESNYPTLYRLAKKMVQQHDGIPDILQDVFMDLHNRLKNGYTIDNPQGWLYRVTFNKCIDDIRRQRKRLEISPFNERIDTEPNPELREVMNMAMSRLSLRERKLALLYSEGLSYKEISGITGIKFSSVGKLLSRTLKKIEKEFNKIGYEMS